MTWKLQRSAFAGLALVALSAPALAATYTVKPGDTLSKLRPSDWQQVCEQNMLANCSRIFVGQKLIFSDKVKQAKDAKPTTRPVVREQSCIKLGVSPWNPDDDLQRTLDGIDKMQSLSPAQKALVKAKVMMGQWTTVDELVPQGQVFGEMLYASKRTGKAESVHDKPLCTPEQGGQVEVMKTIDLGNGVWFAKPRRCNNPSVFTREVVPPQPEPPAPVVTPPAPVTPTTVPASTPEPESKPDEPRVVTEAPKSQDMVCNHINPAVVIGQDHELSRDASHSSFATASVYCLKPFQTADGRTGVHGVGAKATYSNWHGSVNNHAGHYKGWNALAGLAYKRIMDEGTDTEFSVGPGKQVERYHEAAYASRREFDLVGVTVGHNDYRRRLAGETWDVERQYFGTFTLPVGKRVGHTIFGQPLADTAELGRFNFGFQAGARWWFYEDPDQLSVLPYLQGGVFVQHPTSASMSARIGMSDLERVAGVGCGFDKDLQHGGDFVPACGWWLDIVRGVTVSRTKFRKAQAIAEAARNGITIEEKGGFVQVIRFGEPSK